jgi:hypothetical protein
MDRLDAETKSPDLSDLNVFRKTVVRKADSLLAELNRKIIRVRSMKVREEETPHQREVLLDLLNRKEAVRAEKKRILTELRKQEGGKPIG